MPVDIWNVSGQIVLLSDTLRVDAYREAIGKKVAPGDVVVDLGSGGGVMARFAALAGASRVFAVEERLELCELNEHTNQLLGLDRVIEVVHGSAEEVSLRQRLDVVISELIGDLVDDEGMSRILTSFCAAQRRRLRPDVRFIPEQVALWGRFVELSSAESRTGEETADAYRRALEGELRVVTNLEGLTPVGEAFRLLRVDGDGSRSGGTREPLSVSSATGLHTLPRAMACWFEAQLAEGVGLDSRGTSEVNTSWGLPLVPLDLADTTDPRHDLELSFHLERSEHGCLEVEARLGQSASL